MTPLQREAAILDMQARIGRLVERRRTVDLTHDQSRALVDYARELQLLRGVRRAVRS